jgi:dsDNA-specific endonuclease/ATPase MutS2
LKKVPVQVARAEFETFFDEAAKRVEDFGERIEALVTRVEVGTQARFVELEETWRQTQQWLLAQVDNLKQQEQKAEQLLDTARVKVELGKMDVSDMGENLRKRVEPVREAIDGLVARGSSEAADGLKRLSHAFMDLRKELLKKARHSSTLYQ